MSEGVGHMGLVFTKGITPLALEGATAGPASLAFRDTIVVVCVLALEIRQSLIHKMCGGLGSLRTFAHYEALSVGFIVRLAWSSRGESEVKSPRS